ncbi:9266_t:CDS:2 [Funneliformis geosporum]|uniref:Origin recognition complex subunit 2 n=1 Tax=Funneliformis geosporum TaxID=1117311 RepID=A0A9W4WJ16_9GLOM|nr:8360_t:CDS:2 [Funneliformis geosporum]CAI2165921.1 9266_t:CDS:2 [Funneliformis geosporum]
MPQLRNKIPNELKFLLENSKKLLPSCSARGKTIAERNKQRRRGIQITDESENPFVVSEQVNVPVLEEQESITENDEEEMQDEEMDAVTALRALDKEFPRVVIPITNPGGTASYLKVSPRQIKIRSEQIQTAQENLTGSERYFEDNAMQAGRFRAKKTSDDIVSSIHIEPELSSVIERHVEEFNEIESFITKYFTQWEFQLNFNQNILFYGFGSKERILELYQAFYNKKKIISWFHFYGNGDLLTLNLAYLTLLENLFGPKSKYSNFTLVRKADLIRDYFKTTDVKSIFKIIIHDLDGSVFENLEARTALVLLSGIPNIHLLATSESINFFSIWNLIEVDRMNWHAHEITSYGNYKLPMASKKKLVKTCQNFGLEKKEVKSVLMSFNNRRREMFYTLANHIVEAKRRTDTNWNVISLNKFFNYCNKNLVCREKKNFNLYLEDYVRQGIFISNKTRYGETRITIPMSFPDIKAMLLDKEIFGYLNG